MHESLQSDCLKTTEKCLTLNGSQMFSVEGIGDQESEMVVASSLQVRNYGCL